MTPREIMIAAMAHESGALYAPSASHMPAH